MGKLSNTLLLIILATPAAFADQIILKNGDRLSGNIVASDAKMLTLKTEYAETISIKWDFVNQIESSEALYVGTKSGQIVVGPVTTADDKFSVNTKESGTVTVAKADVTSLRNAEEEKKAETAMARLQHPSFADLWAGNIDTGLALVRGNSESSNFTFALNAVRAAPRDKVTLYSNSAFSRSTVNNVTATTAQSIAGGVRYDLNVSEKTFAFGTLDLFNDRFQDLDLRTVIGAGGGYHAVKNDRTVFDVLLGATFNREFFTTINRSSAEILLGETLARKLGKSTTFNEALFFYPNLSYSGNYRSTINMALVTRLSKILSWQTSLADHYLSNPPLGKKTNDLLLSTGLRVTFGNVVK